MQPITFDYTGQCCTARKRNIIHSFLNRFYTPFVIIIWLLVAFDINNCTNVPVMIILFSITAAVIKVVQNYLNWVSDLSLLLEDPDPKVPCFVKYSIVTSDFIIALICVVLSMWWLDDMHNCIAFERNVQAIGWCFTFVLAAIAHSIQYQIQHRRMNEIIKHVYRHVSPV